MMLKKGMVLLVALMVCAISLFAQRGTQTYSGLEKEVLQYINEHRGHIGLQPLVMNDLIVDAAEKHSHDMGMGRVPFGHAGFDERMAKLRRHIQPVNGWAENVAAGDETAKEVVDLWLHSPGHKKNIEGNYNVTGIGIFRGKDGQLYFTQIFMRKN